ncbi:rolling circle replication-associated protein [Agitococcus lubricus]|uniref:Bacteriophage replication gene A protein n=1 Tax=Agitococcus lubricus TaxID=1077255 RepID=A0A2T5IZK8_9GAMM|nr:hypothetical protein [Agitococcus lubricus]PTQ89475.1 bacteriophage replication gene A protein [Agitococcus lubricus]
MALSTYYPIKRGLSAVQLSQALNQSPLTRSDCELLRPLSQKSTLSIDDLVSSGASPSVVYPTHNQGGKSSNQGEASACGEVALSGGVASLPCLRVNNSNECPTTDNLPPVSPVPTLNPSWIRKAEFKVKREVMALFDKYGLDRIGFLTLTFADDVQCHKEATKRLNSLITGVLRERYAQCIRVSERQQSGRWHFHLVVVCQQDIRRGVDFQAIKERRYKDGASATLRAEWAFWRKTAKKYGFGRTELLPVKKTGEALAAYVAKYISKGFAYRQPQDKGARLYSVIGGDRVCSSRFSFYSAKAIEWRKKVALWAASWSGSFAAASTSGGFEPVGFLSYEDLPLIFGKKWAWTYREQIIAMQSPF